MAPPGGTASNYSATGQTAVWPQWTPTTDTTAQHAGATVQARATTGTVAHTQSQGGGSAGHAGHAGHAGTTQQQQQEEFSDMLRMLDNSGTGFTDLSGMFNSFNE